VGVEPAQAAVGDTPAYTYNMQGTASNGDNTWTLGVGPLLTSINSQNPVVALQEAGPSAPRQPLSVPDPPQVIAGNALTPLSAQHRREPACGAASPTGDAQPVELRRRDARRLLPADRRQRG
jgi:hypothetical protein